MLYVGLMLAIGSVVFGVRVIGSLAREPQRFATIAAACRRGAVRIGAWALVALLPVVTLRLVQQAAAASDEPAQWLSAVPNVLQTTWGRAWIAQAATLMIAVAASVTAITSRTSGARWTLAVAVCLLATTPALSGHAAGSPILPALAITADALHVLAAGAWLGTLMLLVFVGLPAVRRHADESTGAMAVASMVAVFSPIALAAATTLAVTGVFAAWLHLDALASLWRTRYGLTLLLKMAALGVVLAAGAWNWRRVTPRLTRPQGAYMLRRSALLELAAGVVVVAITAVLVATPLPNE